MICFTPKKFSFSTLVVADFKYNMKRNYYGKNVICNFFFWRFDLSTNCFSLFWKSAQKFSFSIFSNNFCSLHMKRAQNYHHFADQNANMLQLHKRIMLKNDSAEEKTIMTKSFWKCKTTRKHSDVLNVKKKWNVCTLIRLSGSSLFILTHTFHSFSPFSQVFGIKKIPKWSERKWDGLLSIGMVKAGNFQQQRKKNPNS